MKINLAAMDGNWLLHRSYHASKSAPEESRPRVVARQLASWAFTYALTHQATHFFMAFDGHECFRKRIWVLYKSSRIKMFDANGQMLATDEVQKILLSGVPFERLRDHMDDCEDATIELLTQYGVPLVQRPKFEADDLLVASTRYAEDEGIGRIVLITKDKDMLQGLQPRVVQWYPAQDAKMEPILITYSDMSERLRGYVHEDAMEWLPIQFRDYQILVGDPTDDVPSIVSSAKARGIINQYETLQKFFHTEAGAKFYYAHQEALIRNRKLITMRRDSLDDFDLNDFKYVQPKGKLPLNPSKHFLDYCGWLKVAGRKSLFG